LFDVVAQLFDIENFSFFIFSIFD